MPDSVYLYQLVSRSQSVPSSSSSPLSFALDIQKKLKPFASGEMRCHSLMIHTDHIIYLYFLVDKLTSIQEDSQFSPDILFVALKILNTCALKFCDVYVV